MFEKPGILKQYKDLRSIIFKDPIAAKLVQDKINYNIRTGGAAAIFGNTIENFKTLCAVDDGLLLFLINSQFRRYCQ